MLKLTLQQLHEAAAAAGRLTRLEAGKDMVKDQTHHISVGVARTMQNPLGEYVFDFTIPQSMVRQQFAERIAAESKRLADLGIELIPGGVTQ